MKAQLRLTAGQVDRCIDAIQAAFPTYADLDLCLYRKARLHLNTIVFTDRTYPAQIAQLVDWAESRDKVQQMIGWLRICNSDNIPLENFEKDLNTHDTLEKLVVRSKALFVDPEEFREQMATMERRVCRIEAEIDGVLSLATGFLVGPDLVLTNNHAIEVDKNGAPAAAINFRFNYRAKSNKSANGDFDAKITKGEWRLASSETEELDFAIVRLNREMGRLPIGDFEGAPIRGWIPLLKTKVNVGEPLFVLQHANGGELVMANGGLEKLREPWIEYAVNTDEGSSGAPVFNNEWKLIALHSRAGAKDVNCGILIGNILQSISQGVRGLCSIQPD
jgi:Trypsin-like peptidase domain